MANLGDFFIYTATVSALASAVLYYLAWRGRDQLVSLARNFFRLGTLSVVGALATLLYLILTHDFTVAYVYAYSSLDLPTHYLIASLWGGQEGTFLLWLFYTMILGVVMMHTAKQFERGNMFFLSLFVLSLLMIMIKKSPFELMPVYREDGAGLNPLLQNFWMTIHPPIMFAGFSGVVFPFTFALTALVERKYHIWAEAARRWTMFAWVALGVSLVMGGYWAYETLGWGGFWAWDPVENSSLIPWLFLTTQVHSLFIKRQRRGMMRFSLVAVCLTFWSVLYGTFLTRSGVLADFSVHSFVDLGINQFLVGGLAFFILLGAFWLVHRWKDIKPEPSYSKLNSRSYLVTLGIVILFVGGTLVLIGTSAPLLTRFAEKPSNVGLPYYFATMTPIGVAILLLIALFPTFRWNQGLAKPRLLVIGASVAVITILTLLITGFTHQFIYLALFGAAAWALVVNGSVFFLSWRNKHLQPGYLSHVGLALGIASAALANGFETKQTIVLPQGQPVSVMGSTLTFASMQDTPKGFDCHVDVANGGDKFVAILHHEFPKNAEGVMKKPHVENYLAYDLYLAPVSVEQPEVQNAGEFYLKKGESTRIDKYEFTFNRFDIGGQHGESTMTAAALVTVTYDGTTEQVAPTLQVAKREVTPVEASFDHGKAGLFITGVKPEDGGVVLRLSGVASAMASPAAQQATLVVELSKKPFILFFWLGALIAFSGGLLSMYDRHRRRQAVEVELSAADDQPRETRQPVASDVV
ncbi:MAG: cytochrome c biogenesis protein CcsA [Candidatus Zixiibacteriota bacterium]